MDLRIFEEKKRGSQIIESSEHHIIPVHQHSTARIAKDGLDLGRSATGNGTRLIMGIAGQALPKNSAGQAVDRHGIATAKTPFDGFQPRRQQGFALLECFGSAVIHQDAIVRRLRLAANDALVHEVRPGRGTWIQLITGELQVGDATLQAGDGASTEDAGMLQVTAKTPVEALLFDLG